MTGSFISVRKPSVLAKKFAFVSHLFDASMSTYCWLRSHGWRPCKAFWDHCLLTWLLYSSSVVSSFAFTRAKFSDVHLSSAFITAARREDVNQCRTERGCFGGSTPPPPKFRRPSKIVPNSTRL